MKNNWQAKKLGDVIDFTRGLTYSKSDEVDSSGTAVLRGNNINLGTNSLDFSEIRYIRDDISIPPEKRVHKNSLIITTASGSQSHLGKVALIDKDYDYVFGGFMGQITPKKEINSKYLFYILTSDRYRQYIEELSKGVNINNLSFNQISNFQLNIPSILEQEKIVKILDEVFENIEKAKENTEKNLQNSRDLFDTHLQGVFTNKSKGWEIKKLGEVAEYFNGLTYSPKDVSEKGIIVLRSSNVQNDVLDFSDIVRVNCTVKESIKVKDGDILMCSRNGSKRLVGKTATIQNLKEVMTFGTFMMIIRGKYNPYLSWFFKSSDFRKQISGGENTMINQITRYMLDAVVISIPPKAEQESIIKKLDILSTETKKMEKIYKQKLSELDELKKSILNEAFAGKL